MSYTVISCQILSSLVISCHILSYLAISGHILSYLVISCQILSNLVISCHILSKSCHILLHPVMSCHILSHLVNKPQDPPFCFRIITIFSVFQFHIQTSPRPRDFSISPEVFNHWRQRRAQQTGEDSTTKAPDTFRFSPRKTLSYNGAASVHAKLPKR